MTFTKNKGFFHSTDEFVFFFNLIALDKFKWKSVIDPIEVGELGDIDEVEKLLYPQGSRLSRVMIALFKFYSNTLVSHSLIGALCV